MRGLISRSPSSGTRAPTPSAPNILDEVHHVDTIPTPISSCSDGVPPTSSTGPGRGPNLVTRTPEDVGPVQRPTKLIRCRHGGHPMLWELRQPNRQPPEQTGRSAPLRAR